MSEARIREVLEVTVAPALATVNTNIGTSNTAVVRATALMELGHDGVSDAQITISTDRAWIHWGVGFTASSYDVMTTGEVVVYCFTTPTLNYVHFKNIHIQTLGGSVKVEILKGADVTANAGTALPVLNMNHVSDNAGTVTVKLAPTYTGGTVWFDTYSLADATNQSTGIGSFTQSDNKELVMKNGGEQYIFVITNLETENVPFYMRAFWYESASALNS